MRKLLSIGWRLPLVVEISLANNQKVWRQVAHIQPLVIQSAAPVASFGHGHGHVYGS
jgi:hypothetical protein